MMCIVRVSSWFGVDVHANLSIGDIARIINEMSVSLLYARSLMNRLYMRHS